MEIKERRKFKSERINKSKSFEERQREVITCFLERLADKCSDQMSDKVERHLSFFQKEEVYNMF